MLSDPSCLQGMLLEWAILSPLSTGRLCWWYVKWSPRMDLMDIAWYHVYWRSDISPPSRVWALHGRSGTPSKKLYEYYSHETETEVRLIPTSRVLYGLWSALSLVQYWSGWFLARIRRARASDLGQHFLASFSEECWAPLDKTDRNIYQSYQKLIDDETCQSTRSRWNWSYPVSGLGKIAQFLFAWIHPGNNIITGRVAEAGAQR